MSRRKSIVGQLYSLARVANDVRAASQGPVPLAKRLVRKKVYGKTMGVTGKLLRKVGLG